MKPLKTYSINEWKDLFMKTYTMFKKGLGFVHRPFIAFNANIDYICVLNRDIRLDFSDVSKRCKLPRVIKDLNTLKRGLLYSFIRGKALELEITNKELYYNILNRFKFSEKRIGGQMGIVANTLSHLGAKEVIVFTNGMSKELSKFFNKGVLFPVIYKRKIVLKEARDVYMSNAKTRINIIIEFKKGSKLKTKDGYVICPRNNRFIISSPIQRALPVFPDALIRKELFSNVSRLFLSGYHHVDEKNVSYIFNKWIKQIETIKLISNALIHIEYVDMHKEWLNNWVFKLLNYVDSFGLNEVELLNVIKLHKQNKLYEKILESNYSIDYLIKAGEYLLKRYKLKRLSIHTLEALITIVKDDYPISDEAILYSSMFAILSTTAKVFYGNDFKDHIKDSLKCSINKKGLHDCNDNIRVVVVPNLTCKKKVKYTVGLGDTISSISFYSELLFSNK